MRGSFDLAQHGADVNRLAVVAAVVFAELLHAENFTQSRPDAKKFLIRIPRICLDGFVNGERTRPACGFRRPAENGVAHGKGLGATPKPARGTRALPGRMMPPRQDWGIFGLGFYKDGAPTALGKCSFIFYFENSQVQP